MYQPELTHEEYCLAISFAPLTADFGVIEMHPYRNGIHRIKTQDPLAELNNVKKHLNECKSFYQDMENHYPGENTSILKLIEEWENKINEGDMRYIRASIFALEQEDDYAERFMM